MYSSSAIFDLSLDSGGKSELFWSVRVNIDVIKQEMIRALPVAAGV